MDGSTAAAWAAVVVAIGSLAFAARSLHKAGDANRNSERAIELATSAEERANRLEVIAIEKRDVEWAQVLPARDTALCRIQNVGSDTANDVQLLVDVIDDPDDRRTARLKRVQPKESIELDLIDLLQKANPNGLSSMYARYGFVVRVRVTWRSESGVESLKEFPRLTFSG